MPIGIRPTNDFAFKKTFGSERNKTVLMSLLNSILELSLPITDLTIENPYNERDFQDDKLSVLDVKAADDSGAIYNIEVQLTVFDGLVQRIVFYGCEIYADQLRAGDDYQELRPAFSICLVDGLLWKDSQQVHHAFVFTDRKTGRTLDETLTIHTLEFGKYNLREEEMETASMLDCWLYWLLPAHEYEPAELLRLFPQQQIQQATETIVRISEITEDKAMYDAREKALRDHQWAIRQSYQEGIKEGKEEGEIKLIRTLQQILCISVSNTDELAGMNLQQLEAITADLQERIRLRWTSSDG